ncbi:MAG TPA: translation initiation factor IF-2, partial [Gemmataceae bacterium]|nr:translation initiation factor IF-2 [Gemmataceae bacterium]
MQKEKIRVYQLARELNLDTKVLLDLCKQAGYDVKNQLSNLEPEQRDSIEKMIKAGAQKSAGAAAAPAKPVLPSVLPEQRSIRNLDPRTVRPAVAPRSGEESAPPVEEPAAAVVEPASAPQPTAPAAPVAPHAPAATTEITVPPPQPKPTLLPPRPVMPNLGTGRMPTLGNRPQVRPPVPPRHVPTSRPPVPPGTPTPGHTTPSAHPAAGPAAPAGPAASGTATAPPRPSSLPPRPVVPGTSRPPLLGPRPGGAGAGTATPRPNTPTIRRPTPPATGFAPRPPQPLRPIAPKENVAKPIARFSQEQHQDMAAGRRVTANDLLNPKAPVSPDAPVGDDDLEGEGGKKPGAKGASKAIPGRDNRRRERQERAAQRKTTEVKVIGGKIVDVEEIERGKSLHRHPRMKVRPGTIKPIGPIIVEPPYTVRSISAALGINSMQLIFKLQKDHAMPAATINSNLNAAIVELLAIEFNKVIEIHAPLDAEDQLLKDIKDQVDPPEDLVLRAPIVTIMGHVDHGKTTLLDKIRSSNVVDTEAGGITQVIRAWRVDHGGRPVTFLDTPGHQAFTKMRARGANVTDIAVIVVAADDGVMPQTEEAINHAKAAGVATVVAINKIDMPAANITKTRQQLYSLNLLPDDMGGDTPFVETSAVTSKGIDTLLDQLSVVAELKELKANPKKPGRGTCIEANLNEGEGVQATLLVRDGTLHRGDVILCGHAYGRVRQMYDDLGRPIDEAGPSMPCVITGLDEVPNASDMFYVLPELSVAREIAEKRKMKLADSAKSVRAPLALERLGEAKIAELKVILKADFRGSVEAIRKELEKLVHDEVRVRVLHAAIGGITESDVQLALASPEDSIIVGFNVVPDDRALAMASEKGVSIREYDIIYNLTNDIRTALEGKLKPREEVVHLGRAVVRETFKISKTGTIAGCYVTTGNIKRNA